MKMRLPLADEAATQKLGEKLARLLRPGDVIGLSGALGAGKTCLARAAIETLTGRKGAQSPSFGLVETYDAGGFTLWHFDLYRLEKPDDVWELGLEDALLDGVVMIEWPERALSLLPAGMLLIRLEPGLAATAREAHFRAEPDAGGEWSTRLKRLID